MIGHHAIRLSEPARRAFSAEELVGSDVRLAERRFGRGELIFASGDPDGQLYFLLEGAVRLYKNYGGLKEATVALLRAGEVFGELSLDVTPRQRSFAEALTAARVAVVQKPALKEAVRRHPPLALGLLSSFSERMWQSDEKTDILLNREVSTRLVSLLRHLADRFGEPDGPDTILEIRLTHQELASMVASTREAVSKVMSEFQRDGLIRIRGRRIAISPRLAETYPGNRPSIPGAAA